MPTTRASFWRWTRRILFALLLFLLLLVLVLSWHLRRSLPILDGELALPGLSAPATIERDAHGVPTIHAASRLDAARVLGFLHAQDRFFGMDLNRRVGAGELSALVGPIAVEYDQWLRFFPNRRNAEEGLARMPEADRRLLEAYTDGVNAGLAALDAAPPEYLLPGARPEPWRPEDCILVAFSMFYNLHDSRGRVDEERGLIRRHLPPEVVEYLFAHHPRGDVPLDGSTGETRPPVPVEAWATAIADATAAADAEAAEASASAELPPSPGSNAWAVAPAATTHGRAILANDMHLGLQVPHVWYRASQRFTADDGSPVAIDGPTLPGLPVTIVGSNRHVAWGFTNSYTDQTDLVTLELHPDDPERYRTADGWASFALRTETIAVAGEDPVTHEVRETIWGPVREGADGTLYAVLWSGAKIPRWNMGLDAMATARSIDDALAIAREAVVPTQNLVLADRDGNIAWTLIGGVPDRGGANGFFPLTAEEIGSGWAGQLDPGRIPVVRNPADDRISTANQRLVGGEALVAIGDGGYDEGYRGARIRELLLAGPQNEATTLAIQGDVAADYLRPWQELFLRTLDRDALAELPERKAYREQLAAWNGQAAADSVAYVHLRAARDALIRRLRDHLASPLGEHAQALPPNQGLGLDEVVFDCLDAPHDALVPPGDDTMRELILRVLDATRTELAATAPWGEHNALAMRHAVFGPIPVIGSWFNLSHAPQPGDSRTVRVLRPGFGSSQRLVVSPGHEADGFYHQPAGPSGHFLSPFYRAGHNDWLHLRPSPLLPGPTQHTLRLTPPPDSGVGR